MLLGHRPVTTSESSHIIVSHAPFRPVLSPAPRPVSMSSRKKIIFPAPDAFVFLSSQNRRCGAAPPATHILIEKAVACRALRHRPAAETTLPLPCPHRISPPPRRLCHCPALIVFHRRRRDLQHFAPVLRGHQDHARLRWHLCPALPRHCLADPQRQDPLSVHTDTRS